MVLTKDGGINWTWKIEHQWGTMRGMDKAL